MTTLPRKGRSLLSLPPLLPHTNGKTFKRTLDKFVAGPWSDHCERSASPSPPLSSCLFSICASYLLTWALFNPSPSPSQSRTCRGHIRRCDKADADLPALSLAWGQPAVPACACVIVASHPSASAMGHLQCSIIAPLSGVLLGCFWWQLRWGWPFCVFVAVVVAHSSICGSR